MASVYCSVKPLGLLVLFTGQNTGCYRLGEWGKWLVVGNAVLYRGMWLVSHSGKLARMIRDAVSKCCWFSCGSGKENIYRGF
jgi:hypothetical protein